MVAYLPPKEEQQRFVEFALRFRAAQEQQALAAVKAEAAFETLLSRAFSDGLSSVERVTEEAAA